jgi:hypothetical protein
VAIEDLAVANQYTMIVKLWSAAVHRRYRKKTHSKIVSDTEGMKNTPIHICAKTAFVSHLQQKVGKLVLSITSCISFIILYILYYIMPCHVMLCYIILHYIILLFVNMIKVENNDKFGFYKYCF